MDIYLPIALMSVNVFSLLGIGLFAGILSGVLGIGGGIVTTPALMFLGITPAVAVASAAGQIIASTTSASIVYARSGKVNFKIAMILMLAGMTGAIIGSSLFHWADQQGNIDHLIKISYIVILGSLGMFMFVESLRAVLNKTSRTSQAHDLGLITRRQLFQKKNLTIMISTGMVAGILAAIMGIGGAFIVIPTLVYLLKMPTEIAIGTSTFQVIFVTMAAMLLQTMGIDANIDLVLAFVMITSSVFGAQIGSRLLAKHIEPEYKRMMIATIALIIVAKMSYELFYFQQAGTDSNIVLASADHGFNLFIYNLANQHGFLYVILLIFIAMFCGGLVNLIWPKQIK